MLYLLVVTFCYATPGGTYQTLACHVVHREWLRLDVCKTEGAKWKVIAGDGRTVWACIEPNRQ